MSPWSSPQSSPFPSPGIAETPKVSTIGRVGANSGIDYWNGTLDWTTGLSYFPFLDKFLNLFLEAYVFLNLHVASWLPWMIVI